MSEPVNQWTKSAKTDHSWKENDFGRITECSIEVNASIVYDQWERNGDLDHMYEGIISVFYEAIEFFIDESEFSDAQTFSTEKEALDFINDCLEEWGFDVTIEPQHLLGDKPLREASQIRRN